ncbi:MAG: ABC transporter ATP-binding protein [Acidobacteriota bacterium]|nr:ABC transporter ATP-binding protein [Acidobacteriota bacterium]
MSSGAGVADDGLAVSVRGLTKSYGGFDALVGVDLDVERGQILALLGPNGAGKTTTVEILEGYRRRDGGTVRVLGLDPGRDRTRLKPLVGIVLQSTGVEQYLTVTETVTLYSQCYPHPRPVGEVIERVGLAAKADARVKTLSGGQQRRLDMAVALAGDPELLFLDEPTTGFDPAARHEAWEVVKSLAELGKTILLTTHYMDEAQHLADRVAVIAGGRVIAEGTPDSLGERDRAQALIRFRLPDGMTPPVEAAPSARVDGWFELRADQPEAVLHRLTGWALDAGVTLEGLEVSRPSLEDVYLSLTAAPEARDRR